MIDMYAEPDHIRQDLRLIDRSPLQLVFRRLGLLRICRPLLQALADLRGVRIQFDKQLLF